MNPVHVVIVLACAVCSYAVAGDVDVGAPHIPAYTEYLERLGDAESEIKVKIHQQDPLQTDPRVHYLMIINAVNQLIDWAANPLLGQDYYDVVNRAILETLANPQETEDKVRTQMYKSISKTTAIQDFIKHKQTDGECFVAISYQCDLIIEIAVKTSQDDLLQKQARYFHTMAHEVKLFMNEYASEFDAVANERNAEAYLVNGEERLAPIIRAGAATRREGQNIPPVGSRRSSVGMVY